MVVFVLSAEKSEYGIPETIWGGMRRRKALMEVSSIPTVDVKPSDFVNLRQTGSLSILQRRHVC